MLIRSTTVASDLVRVELIHDTRDAAARAVSIYANRWRSYAPRFDAPVQRPDRKWVASGTRSAERVA